MRWTRRQNGTWRKPEHVKAGWVGDLEQKKYVCPSAVRAQTRGISGSGGYSPQVKQLWEPPPAAPQRRPEGVIPGATASDLGTPSVPTSGSAASRNARKKKAKAGGGDGEPDVSEVATGISKMKVAESEVPTEPAQAEAAVAPEKRRKALEKKLRQVEAVLQKQAGGAALNADELAKIASKAEIEEELASLPV